MDKREEAFKLFRESNGRSTSKYIANELNIKLSQVNYWRRKDCWNKKIKRGAPPGNKNSVGHKGGAPEGNLYGLKKGHYINDSKLLSKKFLAKYLPKITEKIIEDISENNLNSLEILWSNIVLKFASIIRSQKIMHVKNQHDITKEIKKKEEYSTKNSESIKEDYEIQFAWDKQAKFLTVQSKAMRELTNMIMQYEKLVMQDYELVSDEHRLRVELLKSKITNKGESKEDKINKYFEALESVINVR